MRLAFILLHLGATAALAGESERAIASLSMTTPTGALVCPDESALRAAVSARLGYDPFETGARTRIQVTSSRASGKLRAVVMIGHANRTPAQRVLTAANCDELTDALALTLVVVIDPLARSQTSEKAPEAAPPVRAPLPAAQVESLPPPEPDPKTHLALALNLGTGFETGIQPQGGWTVKVGFELTGKLVVAGLDGFLAAPSSLTLPTANTFLAGGQVDASSAGGEVRLCLRASLVSGCAVGRLSSLRYEAKHLAAPQRGWTTGAAAGLRAQIQWPAEGAVAGVLFAEALTPVVRTRLLVDEFEVWSSPSLTASLSAGIRLRIW
jgi:hypothetical protein